MKKQCTRRMNTIIISPENYKPIDHHQIRSKPRDPKTRLIALSTSDHVDFSIFAHMQVQARNANDYHFTVFRISLWLVFGSGKSELAPLMAHYDISKVRSSVRWKERFCSKYACSLDGMSATWSSSFCHHFQMRLSSIMVQFRAIQSFLGMNMTGIHASSLRRSNGDRDEKGSGAIIAYTSLRSRASKESDRPYTFLVYRPSRFVLSIFRNQVKNGILLPAQTPNSYTRPAPSGSWLHFSWQV